MLCAAAVQLVVSMCFASIQVAYLRRVFLLYLVGINFEIVSSTFTTLIFVINAHMCGREWLTN